MHQRPLTAALLVAAGVVSMAQVPAQNPPAQQQPPLFRGGSRVEVAVYATVIDASGRLVPDLDKTDFTVTDDGKPVELTTFSNASQPFTAVVMMDTSASMTN